MSCEDHKNQNVVAFCQDCDTIVCCECMIETHKRHEFEKLDKVANIKREKILNDFVIKKDNILSDLRERYDDLEVSKTEDSKLEESTIKDIHDRAEEIKSHVEHIRDKQASKVRDLFQPHRTMLEGKLTSISAAIETITNISDDPDSLQNKSDVEIIHLHICLNKRLEEMENIRQYSQIESKFVINSGGDFEKSLKKTFGSFEKDTETASDDFDLPSQDKIKSRSLVNVDIGLNGKVKSLHLTGEDTGWVLSSKNILYFANSISRKEYKEKALGVQSFAVSKEGEVYIVTSSSVVQKINTDGTVTRWCEMKPYYPKQIFIRKACEISVLLCLITHIDVMKTEKEYLLWKFNRNGIKIREGKSKYIGNEIKIAENKFEEICLCNTSRRNFFTVDANNLRSEFNGVLGAKPGENFYIADFCYVSKGRIVALDSENHVIYLLDRKCSFIKILTSVEEIKLPEYVSFDQFERLWISGSSGTYILSNWDQ